jgi:small subunit ribosomal protein S18
VRFVNYKDLENLQRLMSSEAALFSKKRSGNCSRHQRMVKRAVKRARTLALLPYL